MSKKKDSIAAKLGKHSRTVEAKNIANSNGPNVYDDVSEFFDNSSSSPPPAVNLSDGLNKESVNEPEGENHVDSTETTPETTPESKLETQPETDPKHPHIANTESIKSTKNFEVWQIKEATTSQKTSAAFDDDLTGLHKSISSVVVEYLNSQYSIELEPDFRKQHYLTNSKDYQEAIEPDEYLNMMLNENEDYFAIHYSSVFCQQYVGLYYGGNLEEDSTTPPMQKDSLSDFDIHALQRLNQNIRDDLLIAINYSQPQDSEENSGRSTACYVLQVHFKMKSDEFNLSFILSENLAKHFVYSSQAGHEKVDTVNVKNTKLELDVIIFETKVDLSYVLNLSPGDLFQIDTNELVKLRVNNKDLLTGTLGHINQQKVVRINNILS